jgi:hypothetical protein
VYDSIGFTNPEFVSYILKGQIEDGSSDENFVQEIGLTKENSEFPNIGISYFRKRVKMMSSIKNQSPSVSIVKDSLSSLMSQTLEVLKQYGFFKYYRFAFNPH